MNITARTVRLRLQARFAEETEDFDGLDAARAVVMGSRPEVPGIEMAADEHDFPGLFRAPDLADDIGRGRRLKVSQVSSSRSSTGPPFSRALRRVRAPRRNRGRRNFRGIGGS